MILLSKPFSGCRSIISCVILLIGTSWANAGIVNSNGSLGELNVPSGATVSINTDAMTFSWSETSYQGRSVAITGGNVAAFDFTNIKIGSSVTFNVTGSKPIAIVGTGNATISSGINVSAVGNTGIAGGGSGGAGGSGGSGGLGGSGGGQGGKGGKGTTYVANYGGYWVGPRFGDNGQTGALGSDGVNGGIGLSGQLGIGLSNSLHHPLQVVVALSSDDVFVRGWIDLHGLLE